MERDDTGSADRQVSALTTSAGTLLRICVTWSSINIDKSCKSPEMQKVGKFGAKLKNLWYIFGNEREFNLLSEWKGYNSEDLSYVLVSDFYQTAGRTNNLICWSGGWGGGMGGVFMLQSLKTPPDPPPLHQSKGIQSSVYMVIRGKLLAPRWA